MASERRARPVSKRGFRLGRILGFEVRIDLSWFVIFFLVFWSLSEAVFPSEYPELTQRTHLAMGMAGTLLFFASLLAHELSHALVSRAKSIPVEGITLFIFGGMAMARREPDTPRDELLIAGIGPVTSFALSVMFEGAAMLATANGLGEAVVGVAQYLAFINLALAIFNLMPGFPLDGGRVFRAIAWGLTKDRAKATRWAVGGGRIFGTLLMVLGAVQALAGAPVGGLWLIFIGWFLRSLAGSSLQQQVLHDLLRGFVAADLMSPEPEAVSADSTLDSLVYDRFMRLRIGSYPVLEGGSLVGMITLEDVRRVPAPEWPTTTAREAMIPLQDCAVVGPHTSVEAALQEMSRPEARGRALVVDRGRLVGIVSASDVARWVHHLQAVQGLVGRSA